jgi:hypothetical protein
VDVGIGSLDEAREEERPTVGRTPFRSRRNTVCITCARALLAGRPDGLDGTKSCA